VGTGAVLPLVQERDSTHAAQRYAGLERLGELLVWGNLAFHADTYPSAPTPVWSYPFSYLSCIPFSQSSLSSPSCRARCACHVEVLSPNTAGASR